MRRWKRGVGPLLIAGLLGPGFGGAAAEAAEADMDLFTPEQLARGGTTEVTVRVGKDALVRSVEVTPPAGVSVSDIRPLDDTGRDSGKRRWSLAFTVDRQAEPGKRAVVLVTTQGRSAPRTVEIPPHVPELSGFTVSAAQMRHVKVDFAVTVSDADDDFGPDASLVYTLKCGASILIGIRSAEATPKGSGKSLVRATIEDTNSSVKEPTVCDLDLELADKKGYKGRLKTAVEFK